MCLCCLRWLWRNCRMIIVMRVWTWNSIVTIFMYVDMANCPLGVACQVSVSRTVHRHMLMHCIRPVSGLESLSSLDRQRNALVKNLANCCITMTGEINHTALKNPTGIDQYLVFLRQSLCMHLDLLLFSRSSLSVGFSLSFCLFPLSAFCFFLFHFPVLPSISLSFLFVLLLIWSVLTFSVILLVFPLFLCVSYFYLILF
jgi:hypothetical protein